MIHTLIQQRQNAANEAGFPETIRKLTGAIILGK
jgi:uncharacterized protein YihD (DUF1040 family)